MVSKADCPADHTRLAAPGAAHPGGLERPGGLDLPALYQYADESAQRSQRQYMRLFILKLLLAILASACGAFAAVIKSPWPSYLAAGSALALVLLGLWQKVGHTETAWYNARATAERVKGLAWLYATRTEPFGPGQSDEDADALLLAELRTAATNEGRMPPGDLRQLTPTMRALRTASLGDRVSTYVRGRLGEQLAWYAQRARNAQAAANRWEGVFFASSVAVVLAGILFARTDVNLVGLLAGVSGAVVSWTGGRRYAAVHRAYAQAAFELSLASERIATLRSDSDLSSFIAKVEATLADEHARWRTARD